MRTAPDDRIEQIEYRDYCRENGPVTYLDNFKIPSTNEEVDPHYDLANFFPDISLYEQYAVSDSESVRHELDCIEDVAFGSIEAEKCDVFPASQKGAPIFIFIHGGWWRYTNRKVWSYCARGMAEAGFTVIIGDYPLCPQATITDIRNSSCALLSWAFRNAEEFNGDREKIVVCGHSAGGHQVGMLAAVDWAAEFDLPGNVLKAGIPVSGLFDLQQFQVSWLQTVLQLGATEVWRQSPLHHTSHTVVPMLVTIGELESVGFHQHSERYLRACQAQGVVAEYLSVPAANHFTVLYGLRGADRPLCRHILEFVGRIGITT